MRSLAIKTSTGLSLEIHRVRGMGRGVFAAMDIPAGTLIDTNATWNLQARDLEKIRETSIGGYWFQNPSEPSHGLRALGLISLMNHSFTPNAEIKWQKLNIGWTGSVSSICKISGGAQ